MWEIFESNTPFTHSEGFNQLCQRYFDLLAPYSQVTRAEGPPSRPGTPGTPTDLQAAVERIFAGADVICSPTMAVVAPQAPDGWGTPYEDPFMGTNFTFLANALGYPAASVPVGRVDGLPVGLQVIARPGEEATVLRVCQAYEAAAESWTAPSLSWAQSR
jgi:Asp-tRNA(Asn)/Glu-tRNA(Gln) amidotransferase A subunit family amidase